MCRAISVVVPCYNSEGTLDLLLSELTGVLENISDSYEIILVNDGSTDKSWTLINDLTKKYCSIRAFNLSKNFGQHNATLCGISKARNEIIVTIDDDLQNPPAEIVRLVEKLESGFDVVYGVPVNKQHGPVRKFGSFALRFILKLIRAKSSHGISSFRALRFGLTNGFEETCGNVVCIDVLFSWTTEKFATVPVIHRPRTRDVSSYTILRLAKFALDIIFAYSSLPLKFIGFSGFIFSLFGLFLLPIALVCLPHGIGEVMLVLSAILLIGGLNLVGLGVIGEYLVRLHASAVKQPSFKIDQVLISEKDHLTTDSQLHLAGTQRTKSELVESC